MDKLSEPTLSNLTNQKFAEPSNKQNELLQRLGKPHIDSFNYMIHTGLKEAAPDIVPVQFELKNGDKISLGFDDVCILPPTVPIGTTGIRNSKIFPTECRQRHETYRGKMRVTLNWSVNGTQRDPIDMYVGEVPVMVKSDICNISKLSPKELIEHNEHPEEWGGYFIIKGLEKIIRMLILTRRNFPIALVRRSWDQRGIFFSHLGVQIRCVKNDQTNKNNILHFLTNGTAKLMFSNRKMLYYAPVCLILRCLKKCSDQYIYKALTAGYEDDTYYTGCVKNMLRLIHEEGLHSHEDCKAYLGKMFRIKFFEMPPWSTDIEVADFILEQCILIHLDSDEDKFNMLVFMTQKLFVFAQDKCKFEGVDSVMMQEILLGGHLYLQIIKEKLGAWLYGLKTNILKRTTSELYTLNTAEIQTAAKFNGGLQNILQSFFSTGNLSSHSGLGLMQDSGFTIIAENINRMRYMSHFRAIHRGSFFTEMRTTEPRMLLPDAWGFICPVHTPDGSPCGLLNHLTMNCQVTDIPDYTKHKNIPIILVQLGMIPLSAIVKSDLKECYTVILDGRILGYIAKNIAGRVVDKLRMHKINGELIPNTTEIAFVPIRPNKAQFPGIFLFTGPARMVRPCIHLASGKIELIGSFEQVYLDICIKIEEAYKGITTHMEVSKLSFLSNLAQLIPMPDCNQSPRNMYQCQMGKQTMGTPIHTWNTHAETKLYRLQTPAAPLFRPVHHDNIELDNYAMGTNAIVAVISYTGYDMEDAMIINKSSYERGFGHGCVYKTEVIDLKDSASFFGRDPHICALTEYLDIDGLPNPGTIIKKGKPFYCYFDANSNYFVVVKFKDGEEIIIDSVRLCGDFKLTAPKKAIIVYRIPRNPSVGDKFASRAGQKGICSQLWPSEDLPFTETGLVPDIIFNPHGFPSRMTIAMMIEVMAGKSASIHGLVHDATPFRFNEDDTAIDYFGRLLEAGGYDYYGTEPMYSGIDGRELNAHIFFGVVHYQRLRHMVADKWQVRRTGPVDQLTRQPVKGRKKGGGIRFGEMERDALISHGASFLLHDRLFHCSDKSKQKVCSTCGSLLAPISIIKHRTEYNSQESRDTCLFCGDNADINVIEIPYIFKYLVTELAAININIKLNVKVI